MAFPQSWAASDRAACSGMGLIITKSGDHPAALSVVADYCIPTKHIIMSSTSDPTVPDLGASPPPFGVRIDSSSGVPNASPHKRRDGPVFGSPSSDSPVVTRPSSNSAAFLDEVGVSRSALRRLQLSVITAPIYYFEITPISQLACSDDDSGIAIGLSSVESVHTYGSDQCPLSIGYHSSGRFIHEENIAVSNESGFGVHDTIGCGIEIGAMGRVFFTCNGHVVGTTVFKGFGIQGESYYPVVILQGNGMSVKTNFGASPFQFQPNGLNICNYAFEFNENALRESQHNSYNLENESKLAICIPNNSGNDSLEDTTNLDVATHPRGVIWGPKDMDTIDSALQMLEQIISAQSGRELEEDENENEDSDISDSYQDVFHLKIHRALTSGLKTISDLVQNEGLASDMQQCVGTPMGDISRHSSRASSPPLRSGEKRQNKISKNTIETVLLITNSLGPVWQKMLDVISESLAKVSAVLIIVYTVYYILLSVLFIYYSAKPKRGFDKSPVVER